MWETQRNELKKVNEINPKRFVKPHFIIDDYYLHLWRRRWWWWWCDKFFFLVLMDKRQMPFHFTIIVISIITIKDVVINFFVTLMIVTNAHAHREQMTMTWHDHQTIQNDKNYCKIFDYQKKSYLPCSESMMIVSKRRKKIE